MRADSDAAGRVETAGLLRWGMCYRMMTESRAAVASMGCEGARLSCVAMWFNEFLRARRRFPAWNQVFPPFSVQLAVILVIHFAALVVMAATEVAVLPKVLFL